MHQWAPEVVAEADSDRQVVRLAESFLLDGVCRLTELVDDDVSSALAFLAVKWANVEHQTSESQAREPVTTYAIGRRLRMPYETTRRHVNRLTAAGFCERVDGGLMVPPAAYQSIAFDEALQDTWIQVRRYIRALAEAGQPLPRSTAVAQPGVRRRVTQLASEHLLDLVDIAQQVLGFDGVSTLVFLEVIRANTWHLTEPADRNPLYASRSSPPPDESRQPVSVYAVARRLRLPYETTRRRMQELTRQGVIRAVEGGHIVERAVLESPAMVRAIPVICAATSRFLEAVAEVHPVPL